LKDLENETPYASLVKPVIEDTIQKLTNLIKRILEVYMNPNLKAEYKQVEEIPESHDLL
jgi:hypothetical protein